VPADTSPLIAALNHSLRRQILRKIDEDEATTSARQLARELGMPIGNVSYHLQVLAKLDVLRQVDARQVRGAKEYFYVSNLNNQDDWFRAALEGSRVADEGRMGRRGPRSAAARGERTGPSGP
jgi:DNA-binding transcriptional ArsR family regulator